jgi:rod shape-determining protein MreB and related proteins
MRKTKILSDFNVSTLVERFWSYLSYDIAIDLGTANTLVLVRGKGILIREPSVVSRTKKGKEVIAIGTLAKKMLGKTPQNIETIRPLKDGVIADFDATAAMLTFYIKKVHNSEGVIPKVPRPRIIIGIPSGVTEVERKAVIDVAIASGARSAYLVEEPMAAAIGAGLLVDSSEGTFIVDIGGGTTEIAAISLGGVVVGKSIRIAGDKMNDTIVSYVRLKYSLLIGIPTAEEIKIEIGSAKPKGTEKFYVARGRDLETGLPKSIKISQSEVREALSPVISEIVRNIMDTIEEVPPELLSDIMQKGIVLAGGGSLLVGLDDVISDAVKMPVILADDPMSCVVKGCGKLFDNMSLLRKISINSK